jgi:hypothetical protein
MIYNDDFFYDEGDDEDALSADDIQDDHICPRCLGCGEGMFDGSSCALCGGSGLYPGGI